MTGDSQLSEKPEAAADELAKSLSVQLWDLDWSAHVPVVLKARDGGSVELRAASVDEVLSFVAAHYAALFGLPPEGEQGFLDEPLNDAKRRFLQLSDRFVFLDGDRVVGVLVGQPQDWSTYYWRTVAFLPEHQGRGLLRAALELTDEVHRRVGVSRIEGDAAPTNAYQIRLLQRLGYLVTGTLNSERYGTVLHFTRYLDEAAEYVFTSRFCRGS